MGNRSRTEAPWGTSEDNENSSCPVGTIGEQSLGLRLLMEGEEEEGARDLLPH